MRLTALPWLCVLAPLLAAGCGQRGPLFLEEPTPLEVGDSQTEDAVTDGDDGDGQDAAGAKDGEDGAEDAEDSAGAGQAESDAGG